MRPIVFTLVVLAAVVGVVGSAPATHLGYKPCRDMRFRRASVSTVRSNYSCRKTRITLRRLLAHGIRGLPEPSRSANHMRGESK